MQRRSRENPAVREFILRNLGEHQADITQVVTQNFGLSRVAANGYIQRLIDQGLVEATGNTRARRYNLKPLIEVDERLKLFDGLAEHHVWRFKIAPHLEGQKPNIIAICQHGFTEMLNNAVDHSGSEDAMICLSIDYAKISMIIGDKGIGIFQKIQNDFKLQDAREALIELSKGGITSNPAKHAGEGIFFTSRMFDRFSIKSGHLFYARQKVQDDDWLIETQESPQQKGTIVSMEISTDADWTAAEVFDKHRVDNVGFRKTHVPVKIGLYPGEQLVSRSQAKRILARFDKFSEVMLDFRGVDRIGQAFADEIFRVFPLDHPKVKILAVGANREIREMIDHVQRDVDDREPRLL